MKHRILTKLFQNKTIRQRILITCIVDSVVLSLLVLILFSNALFDLQIATSNDHLDDNIDHLMDLMDRGQEHAAWKIKDGDLYRGDFYVGGIGHINRDSSLYDLMWEKVETSFHIVQRCPDSLDPQSNFEVKDCPPGKFVVVAGNYFYKPVLGKLTQKDISQNFESSDESTDFGELGGERGFVKYQLLRDEANQPIGAIAAAVSITTLEDMRFQVAWKVSLMIFLVLILSGIFVSLISSKWSKVLTDVQSCLTDIQSGGRNNSEALITELVSSPDIRAVTSSLNVLAKSMQDKKRIDSELEFANIIQRNMMPNQFPAFEDHHEFDIYATMSPAKEVGGDFYDFFMPDKTHIAVVIADVSGKGIPAALFMVSSKNLISNFVKLGLPPETVFEKVNSLLCEINKTGHFITAWLGILDITTGQLDFVNAGHNPPLLSNAKKDYEWLKQRSGFVLAGMPKKKYKPYKLMLEPGSKLFLYTDGITEAHSPGHEFYGEQRLLDYLNLHKDDRLSSILNGLKCGIDAFVGESEQFDDMTMLILEYSGDTKQMQRETFIATAATLNAVQDFAKNVLEKSKCPDNLTTKLLTVIEEIFINISTYAYPDSEGQVTFEIGVNSTQIVMRFTDSGVPFNPLVLDNPNIHANVDERNLGGLGIFMTKKIMDNLEYHYVEGKNILTLSKTVS